MLNSRRMETVDMDIWKTWFFSYMSQNFLLMNGCNHWISQNLKVQFDFPWNQQMRNILEYRLRTGTSCFKLSDFEKYSKYHPKLNQKLMFSARRAKQDLARNAPASIITLQAELYESRFKGSRAAGDSPRWSLRHPGSIETLKYDSSKNRNFINRCKKMTPTSMFLNFL